MAIFVGLLVAIYAATIGAQRTIGAQWSDNMNCVLGVVVAVAVIGLFILVRRAMFGPRING